MIKFTTVQATFSGEGMKKEFSFNLDHAEFSIQEFCTELRMLGLKYGDIVITTGDLKENSDNIITTS